MSFYNTSCVGGAYLTQIREWVQGFAEYLQQDSSNQSEIVMIKLYCCGPDYCSIYPLLYYFFQIRNGLGSSVCCKDSAKPCSPWRLLLYSVGFGQLEGKLRWEGCQGVTDLQ